MSLIHSFKIHGLPNAAWIAFIVGQQFASSGCADPIQEICESIKIKIKDPKAKPVPASCHHLHGDLIIVVPRCRRERERKKKKVVLTQQY